jgi:hypothetical protein
MTEDFIKTSFAGGELSPSLSGRVEIDKYRVGAAVMRNFYVDPQGGASTRPGTSLVGMCKLYAGNPKPCLIPFIFNSDQAYMLEFHSNKMRVIYRGNYVLETAKVITAVTKGAATVITATAHGFSVGDFVVILNTTGMNRPNGISGLNTRTFYVGAATANTVTLYEFGRVDVGDYVPVASSSWSSWISGGTIQRVYEVASPYAGADLFALNYTQSADVLTVVHPDFPAYDVKRIAQTNWQIVQQTYGAALGPPTDATATAVNNIPANPQYFYAYVVTTVDQEGRESVPTAAITVDMAALDQNASPNRVVRLAWTAVSGAYKYRIYKATPVPSGQQGGGPYFYGLVGNSFEASFVDVNFAIKFEQGPPQGRNPFLDKAIASATILTAGKNYVSPYVNITDTTGSGAQIALTADLSAGASPYGELAVANVLVGGTNYTAPTAAVLDAAPAGSGLVLAFNGSWVANPLGNHFVPAPGSITIVNGGQNYHKNNYSNFIEARGTNHQSGTNKLQIDITGVVNGIVTAISWENTDITPTAANGLSTNISDTITFTIVGADVAGSGGTVGLALGGTTNPSVVAYVQQRRAFAASRGAPATLWLSKPGQFTNYDVSDPVQDDDAITASLYAQEINAINALVPMTNGVVALTSAGAYLVSSGSSDAALTPSNIKAPPQAFSGSQALRPLRIGDHIVYAQARGSAVRDLAFSFYSNNFTGSDISILARHLLEGRKIVQWCYAEEPSKLVWAVRDDGVLLSLTYLKEQEVYGWARHDTQGQVISIATIPEDREDAVYAVVQRYRPNFGFQYMVERFASRLFGANPAANIPAQPEEAWCVDAGATHTLEKPPTAILSGEAISFGSIYEVSIINGGEGYDGPLTTIIEDLEGTGGQVMVTQTGGVITDAFVVMPGQNYVAPRITVLGPTGGFGAVLSLRAVTKFRITTEGAPFVIGDVGKIVRVRGGKGPVLAVPAPNQIEVDFFDALPAGVPNIPGIVLPRVEQGDWSMTAAVTTVGGLDHLNDSVVQVLADGNVQTPKTVVDGCIVLDEPATKIIIGQGFTAQLQTMRLEVKQPTSQGGRKLIAAMHLRVKDARGLAAGADWSNLTELKERDNEPMGLPIPFQSGGGLPLPELFAGAPTAPRPLWYADKFIILSSGWDDDGVVCLQQSYPLPATVLAVIPSILLGDNMQ